LRQCRKRMFVLGRGFSLGIAQEAALKLKETCAIQAEPFSSAEVRHGPMRIVGPGFPVLGFAPSDAAGADVIRVANEFADWGANSLVAGGRGTLPIVAAHPAIEPIAMLASFYVMAERLAQIRGMDPDAPPRLEKVTHTR
jgi:glutamine---fructose-6-phosphate transaminase (isomerizing)